MSKILISGLTNIETSVKVDSFPIEYSPIEYPFFGVTSDVSGVGYNVAKALKTLGDDVSLCSIVGEDENGERIINRLKLEGLSTDNVVRLADLTTPESVVLVDVNGRRKIYCDLKDLQERGLPIDELNIPEDCTLAVLTNINFSRPLIGLLKRRGITIATDVHVLSDVQDSYNRDFLIAADILFLSNEAQLGREGDILRELYATYKNKIIVIGCGQEGALAYCGDEDQFYYEKAVAPLGVKNTVGAGDALFSAFLHSYLKSQDVAFSLRYAVYFAGLKIAKEGGANGFVKESVILDYLNN